MASPLNAMELVNAYQLNQVRIAAAEDEMRRNAMMDPYRMEALQTNSMQNRAGIEHQRNALAFQRERAGEENALRREGIVSRERSTGNALAMRERTLQAQMNRPPKAPPGYRWTQDGSLEAIPGGPATIDKTKAPTDAENISAGYASRMNLSGRLLDDLETQGIGKPEFWEMAGGMGVGQLGKTAANLARSPQRQKYHQAQEDWVRAKLRKESGAVIGAEEMDREIGVYFPQVGDELATIKQKAAARKVAEQAMRQAAGKAKVQEADSAPGEAAQETKAIGGKTYVKVNGKWFEK